MRKLKNLLLAALLLLGIGVLLPVRAQAATTTTFTYTDHSVTVRWQDPTLAAGSTVKNYAIYYQYNDPDTDSILWKSVSELPSSTRSAKISGLPKGYISRCRLECIYEDTNGTLKTDNTYFYVNTTPAKYMAKYYGVTYADDTSGKIEISALNYTSFSGLEKGLYSSFTGYQLQLYKGQKRVKTFTSSYTTITLDEENLVKRDAVYKYRVRAYFTNPDTGKTVYGQWSEFKYFDFSTATLTTKRGVQGAKLTLKRVSGVSKYIIKVKAFKSNDTDKTKGYKKTMTITIPASSKKKTVNITKIGSKTLQRGKSYYVEIIPCIKGNSGLVESDVMSTFRFYNYK